MIVRLTKFKGKIVWDQTQPDGQPRRCFGHEKSETGLWIEAKVPLEIGLKKTVQWYKKEIGFKALRRKGPWQVRG